MKIAIFGSTGALGIQLTNIALSEGHDVKVLVRDPSKQTISHDNLKVVKGDVMNISDVESVIAEQDVILSALGVGRSTKPTVTFSKGTQNIINSASKLGVNRLVCVSSAGVEDDPSFPFIYRKIIRPLFLKNIYSDMAEMERVIRSSDVDWTIIQPYTLTNGPVSKSYRTQVNGLIQKGKNISRADVAHLMLQTVRRSGNQEAIAIAY
ncbi:NAD(P)-dependent oxidoreductase [Pontibacillus sp. HMF3514]|uniref:NAD(P)-dependent oxidoreductase n=1 Tax=Pontibacillus sp. HMF3514 TaxID=2692425 RepID=UPI00131FAD87|nr:SDR family oxidoreductase [Pontibacillus sp. HMF3514]QHE51599.1 NAD(P)H-binding protein [Pontibacillus sp. HMF3514]